MIRKPEFLSSRLIFLMTEMHSVFPRELGLLVKGPFGLPDAKGCATSLLSDAKAQDFEAIKT